MGKYCMKSKIIEYVICFPIQILSHKSKIQQTKVICRLLFTLNTHKLQEHLHFTNTFSCVFYNYDVTSLENVHPSYISKVYKAPNQSVVKKIHMFL